ncbi:MAG: beta strand repeat-containing protein, partial [Xenococcus sp. (in: cyanobacteria)]
MISLIPWTFPTLPIKPSLKIATALLITLPFTVAISANPVAAQQIIPNNDGTMTIITKDGNTFNIDGGKFSRDGKNLFHSFREFGLDAGQIANFLSNPNIQNILGRINGGNASLINGLIQVTGGNSNLFLMNPSGIIFGSNASLNVPGDFSATTATGIGFGDGWFNAVGTNDYLNLVGNPNSFNFANAESGIIINGGDLTVTSEHNISLTGGTVINTGTIETEGGNITVAAIPGTNRVRISQEGQLLSLEVAIPQNAEGEALPIRVIDLPNLLRGLPVDIETGLEVAANDEITVTGSDIVIPNQAGTTIVSGTVDASNNQAGAVGGEVQILGQQVGLIGADIDVSGDAGGGTVLVGGDYKGEGTVPNAEITVVDSNSEIKADGLHNGDGGTVITWADETTAFYGNISATGGASFGDGGFVEVSGKENLIFRGTVDVSSLQGDYGTLLLDPNNITINNITILDGCGCPDHYHHGQITINNQVFTLRGDPSGTFTISETALESIAGDANIILEARDNIIIQDLTDNNLSFASKVNSNVGDDSIHFIAGESFSMNPDDAIRTPGRDLTIHSGTIDAGILDTSLGNNGDAGNINLTSTSGDITVNRLQANSLAPHGNSDVTLGTGQGGEITVNSAGSFAATGFENDSLGNPQSIQTTGQAGSGPITIRATSINIPYGVISSFTNSTVESSPTSLTATSGDIVVGGLNLQGNLDLSSPTTFQVSSGFSLEDTTFNIYAIGGKNLSFDVPNIVVPAETTILGSILISQDTVISTHSSANGNFTIDGDINSTEGVNRSLEVQGNPTFEQAIGNINPLSSLDVSGSSIINGGSIRTTDDQTYNGAVTLGTDTILKGANVNFNHSLDAVPEATADLTVNADGTTRFGDGEGNDRVGENNPLASLTTDKSGTTVINTDQITTTGDQTYNNAVELGTDTTLNGANVSFNNSLDAAPGAIAGLTVNAEGTTNFGDEPSDRVGEINPLESLTTDAPGTTVINSDQITTTGNQTYNDAVELGTDIAKENTTLISETEDVILNRVDYNEAGNSRLTIKAGDNINLEGEIADSDPGNDSLNLDLTANTNGDNRGTIAVNGSVNTGGGSISMTNTTGDDVAIDIKNTLNSQGGEITLNGSSNNNTGVLIESDLNSNGGDIAISGISQTDDGVFISGNITSGSGDITVIGNTTVTNDDVNGIEILSGTITTTENGIITLEGTNIQTQNSQITSEDGTISIAGTSGNNNAIVIDNSSVNSNSDITFTGDEIDLISETTISGDTVTLQPQTSGLNIKIAPTETPTTDLEITQAELDTIEANEIAIDGSGTITVENPVTVDEPLTLTTINDPLALTTVNNTIQVDGPITGIDNASITLNSEQTNLNSDITTEGEVITINSNVTLQSNLALDTTFSNQAGAEIDINGTVNGANNLTLDAGSGDINIQGTIGTTEIPLGNLQANSTGTTNFGDPVNTASVNTDAGGVTQLNGSVITTGDQSFNDNVTTASDIDLTTSNGNISTQNITTSGNDLSITANKISTQNLITQGGNIALRTTQNEIATGDIDSSGTTGGTITLDSADTIETRAINSSGTTGNGGYVTIDSVGNIRVASIRADGSNQGGNIEVNVNNETPLFIADSLIEGLDGISIYTNSTSNEAVTIWHGGALNPITPFIVGFGTNPNVNNGTAGAISSRLTSISEGSFIYTFRRQDISLISQDAPTSSPSCDLQCDGKNDDGKNYDVKDNNFQRLEISQTSILEAKTKLKQSAQNPALIYVSFTSPEIKGITNDPEEH